MIWDDFVVLGVRCDIVVCVAAEPAPSSGNDVGAGGAAAVKAIESLLRRNCQVYSFTFLQFIDILSEHYFQMKETRAKTHVVPAQPAVPPSVAPPPSASSTLSLSGLVLPSSPPPSSHSPLPTTQPGTQALPALSFLPPKAAAIPCLHLPSVAVSALPPFTQPCGKPGASGSVFKIEYQGKVAAAKEFHKHMQDMLRRELKSLQLLAHPNIVRVMAVVNDAASQPVGFIMEYLPVPLDDAMQRMTLRQAVHALVEACIGVAVAHDAHVIHSDIKPANMLCSADFSVVKLADFGLAHAVTASLSSVSSARGTPLYVAHGGMACCCCT